MRFRQFRNTQWLFYYNSANLNPNFVGWVEVTKPSIILGMLGNAIAQPNLLASFNLEIHNGSFITTMLI
ncbi:hypothetical protein [Coleofasciculus sp. H7-2]|uniref:hypothetical protein n=1 Tax=Coleofasciculus sp. H7-2 TaxID=3351545 RepID=UPI003672FAFA